MSIALEVGQKLWYVEQDGYRPVSERGHAVTVKKIGRKWASLEGWGAHRINIETLWADGGQYSSPGRCYLSAEEYKAELSKVAAWHEFVKRMRYVGPPPDVSEETIRQVAAMLHIPLGANA